MMKASIGSALLLAMACGGGNKNVATAPTQDPVEGGEQIANPTEASDPKLAFRKGYSNPGGMWLPEQMTLAEHTANFEKMGVAIPAAQLANPLAEPLAAIVSLGGCSASFVSAEGLVVTNHHCVQNALQYNSTPENNLVENGFLAKTRADEKSAGPAQRVMVAQAFSDITAKMRDGLDKISDPIKRRDESEQRLKDTIAACEKDRPGIRCSVNGFFAGGKYTLIEYLEIRDVRLVYVPHRAVGNYGGEIDNWAWPRHTGDFSFYRAYVGKDGKPADFSPDNVPYAPKHHLKVSTAGLKAGDFVMVAGYPGSTERTATAAEVKHDVEWGYPYRIEFLKQRYALLEELIKAGAAAQTNADLSDADKKAAAETALKAGVAKQFVQNGLENSEGTLKGLTSGDLLARKDALEAKIVAWLDQPEHADAKAAVAKYNDILAESRRTARVDFDRSSAFGGSRLLGTALGLVRWAEERPKADSARKAGYQARDLPRAIAGQKSFARNYNRALDRAGFKLALTRAAQLPEADRPWLATMLGVKPKAAIDSAVIDKALDRLYATTKVEDEAVRLALLEKGTTKQLKASKDPFIKLALALWPTVKAEEKKSDSQAGELLLYAPAYVEAMKTVLGGALSPDANSTLRITYGTVKSFKPTATQEADWPFTTAAQIAKKDTGKDPFDSPKALLEAIKNKKYGSYADARLGGELPVNFLSDLDITGGNSGSATLNDKGELVGLAFDGTIEGVASDVVFNGETTRTIQVDARYMLWTMDAIDGADHLLQEMGITPSL